MSTPSTPPDAPAPRDNGRDETAIARPPDDLLRQVQADVARAGGELPEDPAFQDAIGATMFDLPGSEDNSLTVLLPQEQAQRAPSQTLVRIRSRGDGRNYLGIVTAGPFAEPDTLRADSHLLTSRPILKGSNRGAVCLPREGMVRGTPPRRRGGTHGGEVGRRGVAAAQKSVPPQRLRKGGLPKPLTAGREH